MTSLFHGKSALAGGCPTPSFDAARMYQMGDYPGSTVAADFNGDGRLDLAVPDSGVVSVLLGNGDGTFQGALDAQVPIQPGILAAGDLNGDGKLDLVGPNVVLPGKGDGSFQAAVVYRTGGCSSLAIGEFNGDGKLDLVVGVPAPVPWQGMSAPEGRLLVLLGNGDGSFRSGAEYRAAGAVPASLVLSDLNADGTSDLVVAIHSNHPRMQFSEVSVLLGNGDGTFQSSVGYGARPAEPEWVAVGDFNGDGKPDIVSANFGFNNVSVLLGMGNGAFQSGGSYSTGTYPRSVAVGDFNGDGKLDVVTANSGSANVSLLLGKGDGSFHTTLNYVAGQYPHSVAVADFDADGKADLAVSNADNVLVLMGKGDAGFIEAPTYDVDNAPCSVATGDLNGDGKLDLVTANNGSSNVSVLLGRGDGTLQTATHSAHFTAGSYAWSVGVHDLNRDGKADLVVGGGNGSLSVLLGSGDGTFQAPVDHAVEGNAWGVAVGDFNRDGMPDVAVAGNGLTVLLGNGDGSLQPPTTFAAGSLPSSLAVGEFNGDGKLDVAIANGGSPLNNYTDSSVSVLLGRGDGTFQAAANYETQAFPHSVVVNDFNGDDKPDVAVANRLSSSVSVLLGRGDGTFAAAANYGVGGVAFSVAADDFTGDGKADLATANASLSVSLLLGRGDGTFETSIEYAVAGQPFSLAVGDLNTDGKPDLVTANRGSSNVSVLVNTCVSSGPKLAMARESSVATLSWLLPSSGFVLESTTSLGSNSWHPAAEVPSTNNGRLEVTVPLNTRERYFRLRTP